MRIKLEDTPQEIQRRVINKLESLRGTPMASGKNAARLGAEVCPIYRPDIDRVAYWEFEITGLKATQTRDHDGPSSNTGFMLAAAGRHDIPIPHWSLEVEPPSRALETKAKDGKVARIMKLDTLAYAAEDENGMYLTHLGQFPLQIVGLTSDLDNFHGISTVTATSIEPSKDDTSPSKLEITHNGADVPKLQLLPWESWEEAKRVYGDAYRVHLDALASHAAKMWEIEDLLAKFGEGIYEGQRLTIPLLKKGKVKLIGEGATIVKLTQLDREPQAVTLEALSSKTKGEVSFELTISYDDRTSETLSFFIIPKGTPSNNRSIIPYLVAQMKGGTKL